MAATTLPRMNPAYDPVQNTMNLPGAPVIADEDLQKQEAEKKKKDKKNKDKKNKDKKKKKDSKKEKKENNVEKPVRQAVGVIVIDPATQKVLMLASRKREGAYVLPRGDCNTSPDEEHPEKAALRILHERAGVSATFLTSRVGSYSEANKKGKVVAHHWMYELHSPILQDTWPESERERVWVPYKDALAATENKRMSHLALEKCSLAKTIV